jgi:glyoxylase-like metal-dependent hydrolase (beta-lactamase superfamily II)
MFHIKSFTFNPFEENTYLLFDETNECIIIDPGCYMEDEKKELIDFIEANKLTPVQLLNTHCHVDHIFGNKFLFEKYKLLPECHKNELQLLAAASEYSKLWGIFLDPSPTPKVFLDEEDEIKFGHQTLKILFTPGHSPGSICFYHVEEKKIISGDVLFQMSIGRTDLPMGDYDTLIESIRTKLFTLPDDVKVFAGHGPATTIGFEKKNNPFLKN